MDVLILQMYEQKGTLHESVDSTTVFDNNGRKAEEPVKEPSYLVINSIKDIDAAYFESGFR